MAYYEHLPIYRKAMETAVYFENIVRNFSRYNKYNLGAEMRTKSRDIVKLIICFFLCITPTIFIHQACQDSHEPVAGAKIYWVEGGISADGAIKVAGIDGSGEKTLVTGSEVVEPDGIDVDLEAGKIYWSNMGPGASLDDTVGDGTIMRSDLDGGNVETLIPQGYTTTPKQIALDRKNYRLYWSDRGDVGKKIEAPKIMRATLDDKKEKVKSIETIISKDIISPVGIALDVANGKLYFSDRYANKIKRSNLDGSDVEVVVANTTYPVDLALDLSNRQMYWTSRKDGAIYRASMDGDNMDGGNLTAIVTGLKIPIGIALDTENGKMYYTNVDFDSVEGIYVADIDGKGSRRIIAAKLPLGLVLTPQ